MLNYKKIKAFTLAEILVTLALVGILTATLVPNVMKVLPDKNKVMFRKAYHSLEQAVHLMINDNNLYPGDQLTAGVQRGFNYTDDTGGSGTTNKFCYHLVDSLNTIGATSCPTTTTESARGINIATTSDGITWYISLIGTTPTGQFPMTNHYMTKILVDVNGSSNAPNCLSDINCVSYGPSDYTCGCNNPDTFIIGVRYDGRLRAGMSYASGATTTITDQTAIDYLAAPTDVQK